MANVRDSDTSLWLHNKLGISNDSWISGSICSQLNKEVLRNIKECFPDLQTQVKLKLLLSFFHIPRRLVEEWKSELEEVIEVAGLDSELWVSMLAETMKTFPATSSLNTEISDYEDNRPIFTDMVNDLRKLVSKHSDLGMLPLECQYLNKNALISVVGQQQNPVKHFTLKRKPKSANLRTELLHKSADAQSSLKKSSAPTIPLRSRGMPRKMTDTTPLKGIPSRVPTSGFRSPNVPVQPANRPNVNRSIAGRKDCGIKLIEFTEQPLGYAAAKKRKREQQLEEQQKKHEQKQNAAAALAGSLSPSASPAQSSTASAAIVDTPTTPATPNATFELKSDASPPHLNQIISAEEVPADLKEDVPTSEPITPDYAPALTYTTTQQMPKTTVLLDTTLNEEPSANLSAPAAVSTPTALPLKATNTIGVASVMKQTASTSPQSNNNNNNNLNHSHKRVKQDIEIKSEEILVPAIVKVEKIESQAPAQLMLTPMKPQKQQVQQNQQTSTMGRLPQRMIIQQQQQTVTMQQQQQQPQLQQQQQHVLIRAAPQQQKQTLSGSITLQAAARLNSNKSNSIKMDKLDIKPLLKANASLSTNSNTTTTTTILTPQQLRQAANPLANLPNNISVKITSTKPSKTQQQQQQQQQQPILINSSTPVILSSSPTQPMRQKQLISSGTTTTPTNSQTIKSMPLSQLKSAANSGPVIISQTIIQPAKRVAPNAAAQTQQTQLQQQQSTTMPQTTQYIITSSSQQQHHVQQQSPQQQQHNAVPTLTSFTQPRLGQQATTLYHHVPGNAPVASTQTQTKILLKTNASSSGLMMSPMRQQQAVNPPPPLISTSTSQPTLLGIQNVQLPNRPVTIQPASQAAQQQHMQAQLQQHQPQLQQQHTIVSNTTATQQPKLTQVLLQANASAGGGSVGGANSTVKNKTIFLPQKGVILRNIGGDMYQQIPISNVSGLSGIGASGGTTLMTTTTATGPPGLVKTTASNMLQQQSMQTIQLQQQPLHKQQLPTLIPTSNMSAQQPQQHMIVQQQHQQHTQTNIVGNSTQQAIIRPVMSQGGLTTLPQGLTLIQRPGQQPQLVQLQSAPGSGQQSSQLQRTIITQTSPQPQQRSQQIMLQRKVAPQQRIITTTTVGGGNAAGGQTQQVQIQKGNATISPMTHIVHVPQQQQTQQQQAPQRKGLSLSNEHVHKAHEMFRKANRVSRPDKALILGFMAGLRENPRPNSENVIIIKLGETEENVQQEDGTTAGCLVESLIRLDYNTGEWKTFQNYRRLDQTSQHQSEEMSVAGSNSISVGSATGQA